MDLKPSHELVSHFITDPISKAPCGWDIKEQTFMTLSMWRESSTSAFYHMCSGSSEQEFIEKIRDYGHRHTCVELVKKGTTDVSVKVNVYLPGKESLTQIVRSMTISKKVSLQ